jgi:hypothetical protein
MGQWSKCSSHSFLVVCHNHLETNNPWPINSTNKNSKHDFSDNAIYLLEFQASKKISNSIL